MYEILASIDWLKLIQTGAAVFTAFVAYTAVNTWKHQAKANKQTDFLDELTDAIHEYINVISRPTDFLKYVYIGFESHKNLPHQSEHDKYSHIIAYIKSRGVQDSKAMWEYINNCNDVVVKIESMVSRGQVYGFMNYNVCQDSVKMLVWQYHRLQVVASIIRAPTMNWQHPEVIKGIENMLTVQPSDIEEHLSKYNLSFLNFINDNYNEIYKGT